MRRFVVIVAVLAGLTATASSAATPRATQSSLAGKWRGTLTGTVHGTTRHEQVTFTINSSQTAGTWKVSASCQGKLTLVDISGGSHHFRRHLASGSTCAGGDIDCLWPHGTTIYDNVTPRPNGWNRSGTLHRLSTT
jgi:hypothetical protein